MRKLLVSAGAALAGVALLLGGTGTLATWNDAVSAPAQKIQSGTLEFGVIGSSAMTWTLAQEIPGGPSSAPKPYTGQRIVPGDVLTTTVQVPVRLIGDHMKAEFVVSALSLTPAGSAPGDAALASALIPKIVSIGGGVVGPNSSSMIVPGTGTVAVVVRLSLPWETTETRAGSVRFNMNYTLTQKPQGAPR